MELVTGDEKRSLPLCVYVADFGKSSHIYEIEYYGIMGNLVR